jgi:hypothetical protein
MNGEVLGLENPPLEVLVLHLVHSKVLLSFDSGSRSQRYRRQ